MAITILISNFNSKTETELISLCLLKNRADGIIVLDAFSKINNNAEIPIIVINSVKEQKNIDCVSTDFYNSIFETIYQFKINGHKKIGFIGETLTQDKYDFFVRAMKEHNLEINENYIEISKYRFETAGYLAMEKLFEKKEQPTAILAAYDYIALGMLQSIRAHGKKVPEDFSIIGIDDISFDSFDNISLTSIKTNVSEICDIALQLLFKKIENKYYKIIQNITVKGTLILRNSVKKS
jgi:LacI family transcriptional regulator